MTTWPMCMDSTSMYAETLVKDLSTGQMVEQPNGVINHAAWSLGHLVVSANSLSSVLGLESNLPEGWDKTFATGGEPSSDLAAYPTKDEIVSALKEQHARNTEALKHTDPDSLAKPHPNENTRKYFPTIGDMVVFLMTAHEMDHLGQIAALAPRDGTRLGDRGLVGTRPPRLPSPLPRRRNRYRRSHRSRSSCCRQQLRCAWLWSPAAQTRTRRRCLGWFR